MRFIGLFTMAVAAIAVTASPMPADDAPPPIDGASSPPEVVSLDVEAKSLLGIDLSLANFFGAPYPPWTPGAHPGWYFGDHGYLYPELTCLEGIICAILELFPEFLHCPYKPPQTPPDNPPPSDGYHQTFSNLTGATQAGDYMTYGLVDTVAQCKAMCDSVSGCNFVNSYHDVNGKGGSTQLTCSLFTSCHTESDADNKGGQTQPDGSIDYITESNGWCKD